MTLIPTLSLLAVTLAPVATTHVYKDANTQLEGYVAYPEGKTKAPVVLIVHDWNGIDAYEQGRARQMAELGYIGFAIDIYGKGVRPKNAQESGAESAKYYANHALLMSRVHSALAEARKLKGADPKNMAIMGYCFGGTVALETARSGAELKGAVSFHGGLKTQHPAQKGQVKASVLVLHGNADPLVPESDVRAFKDEMSKAGVQMKFVGYDGAKHAFTVPGPETPPGSPTGYDKAADEGSFREMKAFFKKLFG